jgi:hypothetical protein
MLSTRKASDLHGGNLGTWSEQWSKKQDEKPMWIVFALLSIVCFALGVWSLKKAPAGRSPSVPRSTTGSGTWPDPRPLSPPLGYNVPQRGDQLSNPSGDLELWDERSIAQHLNQLRGQSPTVVAHYIESIKTRFVLNQNDKTAVARSKFLKTQIDELKLFREGEQVVTDLKALGLEREKRLKTLQLENAQLDDTMRTRSERERLIALKERKQIELEIAQIEKQMEEMKNPRKSEPELTAEQRRNQEKQNCEARMTELKAQKQVALKVDDEDERMRKVNAIDAALEHEYERWAKLL